MILLYDIILSHCGVICFHLLLTSFCEIFRCKACAWWETIEELDQFQYLLDLWWNQRGVKVLFFSNWGMKVEIQLPLKRFPDSSVGMYRIHVSIGFRILPDHWSGFGTGFRIRIQDLAFDKEA